MNIGTETAKRSRQTLTLLALLALGVVGCHTGGYYSSGGTYAVGVGTAYGPYWYPDNYGTFTIVRYPWWGDPPPPPQNDPRREGSITQRAIAEQTREAFAGRGYRHLDNNADVDVAVYASSDPQLDISGYTHDYDWKNIPKLKNKTTYPKGTIVVDVLAPHTHELLWRGTTVAPISSDPDKYQADLREAVSRVIEKYPKAKGAH